MIDPVRGGVRTAQATGGGAGLLGLAVAREAPSNWAAVVWKMALRSSEDRRQGSLSPQALLTAVLVLVVFSILYLWISGPRVGDWSGYEDLYRDEAGWLQDQNRDFSFSWLIRVARSLFGLSGYETFRLALFTFFGAFAAWMALRAPPQKRIPRLSTLYIVLSIVTVLFLKSLVQIREGLAFVMVAAPTVSTLTAGRSRTLWVGLGAAVATTFHIAMGFLFLGWLIAVALRWLPDDILGRRRLQTVLFFAALVVGALAAFAVVANSNALRFLLRDYGVDASAHVQTGVLKTMYWACMGWIVLTLRSQVMESVIVGQSRFAFSFATVIASLILPAVYALSAILVLDQFPTPALTSLAVRILLTSMELSLLIVTMCGNASLSTLLIALFMLFDRLRLLFGVT